MSLVTATEGAQFTPAGVLRLPTGRKRRTRAKVLESLEAKLVQLQVGGKTWGRNTRNTRNTRTAVAFHGLPHIPRIIPALSQPGLVFLVFLVFLPHVSFHSFRIRLQSTECVHPSPFRWIAITIFVFFSRPELSLTARFLATMAEIWRRTPDFTFHPPTIMGILLSVVFHRLCHERAVYRMVHRFASD